MIQVDTRFKNFKMNFFNRLYEKSILENDKNVRFWEDYLQSLKKLDFTVYAEKLKVPILVPIGSRIQFRGELKHTNEVTVSLGADYFAKCSLKQAEVLKQHRIKGAQEKLNIYKKERDYLQNQMSFNKLNIFEDSGQDIVEVYSEEEDKAWRTKHMENVRLYKQKKVKEETHKTVEITDEELWTRLDELELQEELEEYLSMRNEAQSRNSLNSDEDDEDSDNSFIIKEDAEKERKVDLSEVIEKRVTFTETDESSNQNSKLDLLQQVLDKQNELENKLLEMKHRERSQSKSEADLISKMDEMDQLDELEDEMDRLDDILQNEDIEETVQEEPAKAVKLKRSVSFADEDESETLELTFEHSEAKPINEPYNQERGIQKPSDIYEAYPNLFDNRTFSILKKSKKLLRTDRNTTHLHDKSSEDETTIESCRVQCEKEEPIQNKTIVIKDIMEKENINDNKVDNNKRPVSLFKKKRLQNKT